MRHNTHRREFLRASAWGAGLWVVGSRVAPADGRSPNGKLNIGVIGVGGRGAANLAGVSGENVVALCDIDDSMLDKASEAHSQAKRFHDFRKMLEERKDLDAVTVSTADHCHAPAAAMAMKLGKHVYCEKPLTHSIHEARALAEIAARTKVVTQMGNQGHSNTNARVIVELVRSGTLGTVKEVHAWTNRPIWPQGIDMPKDAQPVPKHVHWDLWVGPAAHRPYNEAYHPFKWRGFWDFGTGALGDMACHLLDAAFWALDLRDPSSVQTVEIDGHNQQTAPKSSAIRYDFPERDGRKALTLTWYEGGKKPPQELFHGEAPKRGGVLIVGEKGTILVLDDYNGRHVLLPRDDFKDFKDPEPKIAKSPGHHKDFIEAIKEGRSACSHFGYAAALTETVLLGNLALRLGDKKVEWDAANMRSPNCPEAEQFVRTEYRRGWEL